MNIALDIGSVLCRVDLSPFFKAVHNEFGLLEKIALTVVKPAWHDIGITDIKTDFYDFINTRGMYGSNECQRRIDRIYDIWMNEVVHPIPEIVTVLEELVTRGRVALLSNIGSDHAKVIREKFPPVFNKCIQHFSCEVGARKPSKLFFQSFLMDEPHFHRSIFVDDLIENVEMAKKCGFRAVRFNINDFSDDALAAEKFRQIVMDC